MSTEEEKQKLPRQILEALALAGMNAWIDAGGVQALKKTLQGTEDEGALAQREVWRTTALAIIQAFAKEKEKWP